MRLVYTSTEWLLGAGVLEDIFFVGGRVPESGVVCRRHGKILRDIFDPGWETVDPLSVGKDERDLDLGVVRYGDLAMLTWWDNDFENTKVTLFQGVRVTVPFI